MAQQRAGGGAKRRVLLQAGGHKVLRHRAAAPPRRRVAVGGSRVLTVAHAPRISLAAPLPAAVPLQRQGTNNNAYETERQSAACWLSPHPPAREARRRTWSSGEKGSASSGGGRRGMRYMTCVGCMSQ